MDCGCGPFTAYCDMEGNWTVFQRRFNGAVGFYRNWNSYVSGFGNPRGEYWMGLDNIHCMTNNLPGTKLRVELGDWEGNSYYAEYSQFVVGDSNINYEMTVSGFSGDVTDQLSYHSGQMFTTYDQGRTSCAVSHRGGWWYNSCHAVNLNGEYLGEGVSNPDFKGLSWYNAKPGADPFYSFKFAEMKLKFTKK